MSTRMNTLFETLGCKLGLVFVVLLTLWPTVVRPAPGEERGAIVTWGWNGSGQTIVPFAMTNSIAIAAGGEHSVALLADGVVFAWGNNTEGQCNVPPVMGAALSIGAGDRHSLAVLRDGTVMAWGYNGSGQVSVPVGLTEVVAVAGGTAHSVALQRDGSIVAWGNNSYGQCSVPAGLSNVVAVAAGVYHTVALTRDGRVVAWGWNRSGQTDVPVDLSPGAAIAAGTFHTTALRTDGTVVGWGGNSNGVNNVPGGLSNVVAIAAGGTSVLALRGDGSLVAWGHNNSGQTTIPAGLSNVTAIATSGMHSLAVATPQPIVVVWPSEQVVTSGSSAVFDAQAGGAGPLSYQWFHNGDAVSGATENRLVVPSVRAKHAGSYTVVVASPFGSVTSAVARLLVTIPAPVITGSPLDLVVTYGQRAEFTVTASGEGDISYQWYMGSNAIPRATSARLSIRSASHADEGDYWVVVSNSAGLTARSLDAKLIVLDTPKFANQPVDRSVELGGSLDMTVSVYGAPPLVVQWYFNGRAVGSPIVGTNVATFAITNALADHSGWYHAQVFNGFGSAISLTAFVAVVVVPPTIVTHPVSQNVVEGRAVTFAVSANGTSPLRYQWQFDGADIPLATNASYTISGVKASDAGIYSVEVWNPAGRETSRDALLSVTIPPHLTIERLAGFPLLSLYGVAGSNYVVQHALSPDATNWFNLRAISNLTVVPYQFLDVSGVVLPARFYRAVMY